MAAGGKKRTKRKTTILWDDPAINARAFQTMSGWDYLQSLLRKEIPHSPVMRLIGYRLAEVESGRAVFELIPEEVHCNPQGSLQGGVLTTIMDSAMASAIRTRVSAGVIISTIDLQVNFIRPVTLKTGLIRCEGELIRLGAQIATAAGRLVDRQGKLYVQAITSCLIVRSKRPEKG